jgi:hypothetical protein
MTKESRDWSSLPSPRSAILTSSEIGRPIEKVVDVLVQDNVNEEKTGR